MERKEREAENELKTVRKVCGRVGERIKFHIDLEMEKFNREYFQKKFFSPRRCHRDFLSLPHRFELCAKV